MRDVEIASIYCSPGCPDPNLVRRAFQITPSSMLASIAGKVSTSGMEIRPLDEFSNPAVDESLVRRISIVLKKSTIGRMVGRNLEALLWWVGPWRSEELDKFLSETAPNLLFVPLYASAYMNRLVLHILSKTGVPLVAYVSDDVYSLRQFSLSPVFWIRRLGARRLIRRVTQVCDSLYVISNLQKEEYEKSLGVECRVLTKLADFSGTQPPAPLRSETDSGETIFTYAGNIGNGRWKTLRDIGRALTSASEPGNVGLLHIYTMTPVSRRMSRAFEGTRSIRVHSALPPDQLRRILDRSDVLVLAEPTDIRGRLSVRHSFSTKVVEYMQTGRPILLRAAVGQASGEYLSLNRAAMVSTTNDNLEQQVRELMTNIHLRSDLARAGWELGRQNHDITKEVPKLERYLRSLAMR